MVIRYLSSYDRSFKKLERYAQDEAIAAIDSLLDFFQTRQKPEGLGLKKLQHDYWEIRLDIRHRIIFHFHADVLTFVLVGDHNAIKQFLKS